MTRSQLVDATGTQSSNAYEQHIALNGFSITIKYQDLVPILEGNYNNSKNIRNKKDTVMLRTLTPDNWVELLQDSRRRLIEEEILGSLGSYLPVSTVITYKNGSEVPSEIGVPQNVDDLDAIMDVTGAWLERKIKYLPLEEAALSYRYSKVYIKELARKNIIGSIGRDGSVLYSNDDLDSRRKVPEGYMSLEDGVEKYGFSENYIWRLVKKSKASTVKVLGAVHFSVSEFEDFLRAPRAYRILDNAAEVSIFERDTIRKLLSKGKVRGVKRSNKWHVSMITLRRYEAAYSNGNGSKLDTSTIDDLVNSDIN